MGPYILIRMKTLIWAVVVLALLGAGFYAFTGSLSTSEQVTNTMRSSSVEVIPIEHASAILRWSGATVYMDPTGGAQAFAGKPPADIVLVTDIHGDHFSTSTLGAVVGSSTTLIVPQAVKDQLPAELSQRAKVLANDASLTEDGFNILAVPMYNLPDAANANFHTKGRGNGYVISRDDTRVYIAGDTAGTPEMRALTGIDIAFVPMNLPYTMSVEEAADAVLAFEPKTVYPYHYRGEDGLSDVSKFKQLVSAGDSNIEVVLANWYPDQ